jgi:hypothetical protein
VVDDAPRLPAVAQPDRSQQRRFLIEMGFADRVERALSIEDCPEIS